MILNLKTAVAGLMLGSLATLAGCTIHAGPPAVEVDAGPAPAAYYEPTYYDSGWYEGDVWYWNGPDHHRYHEFRGDHERRMHERFEHEHHRD